jgi:hypothetical protein
LGFLRLIKRLIGRDTQAPERRFEKCTVDQTEFKKMLLMRKVEAARGISAQK